MKVRFGSIWLAPGGIECASGLTLNGQQVNDPIQYYRAPATIFRPRGLRSEQIAFSVTRQFDTTEQAERFILLHTGDLPQQASLYCLCGDTDTVVLFEDAVIDSISRTYKGVSVTINYSFSASAATTDVPPPDVVEPDPSMTRRGPTAIPSGAETLDVVFSTPFASVPEVVVSMRCPAGGDRIWAEVVEGTISTDGFTAQLSAPTPGTGYKLGWIASA